MFASMEAREECTVKKKVVKKQEQSGSWDAKLNPLNCIKIAPKMLLQAFVVFDIDWCMLGLHDVNYPSSVHNSRFLCLNQKLCY